MNRRVIIAIIVAAAVLLLGVLVLLVVMLQEPTTDATVVDTTNTITTNANTTSTIITTADTPTTTPNPTPTTSLVLNDETALRRVISNFTERFGSYSTDTNYENVTLSRSLMTDTMVKTADSIVATPTALGDSFYSIESRVMTTTLTDYTPGATGATAKVDVRQTVITGQADPTYRNQTARLTLVKVGDTWKVDSFRWL